MRTHTSHVIRESRRELGMKELEGSPSRGPRKCEGSCYRETEQGVLRMASGEAQLPEGRRREPDIEKIGMEEPDERAAENARRISFARWRDSGEEYRDLQLNGQSALVRLGGAPLLPQQRV